MTYFAAVFTLPEMSARDGLVRQGWRAVRKLTDGVFAALGAALRIGDRLRKRRVRR